MTTRTRTRRWANKAALAPYIGRSERWVTTAVADRTLPHYKVGGAIRFDLDEIDEWLADQARGPRCR